MTIQTKILLCGPLQPLYPFRKDLESRYVVEGVHLGLQHGSHSQRNSFIARAAKSVYLNVVNLTEQSPGNYPFPNEPGCLKCKFTNTGSYSSVTMAGNHSLSSGEFRHMETYNLSTVPDVLMDFTEHSTEGSNTLVASPQPETLLSNDIMSENVTQAALSGNLENELSGSTKASIGDYLAGINKSFNASINEGGNALRNPLDTATSLIRSVIKNATESVDNVSTKALSAVDQIGELANKKLTSFSSELNGVTNQAPAIAVDVLRRTILAVENSLTSGASYVVNLYESAKELLPAGIKVAVNVYEYKAKEILRPIGSASQEIYMAVYSLEKSLGLDPNDPIVPFVVFVVSSATLWSIYWLWTYGGYSGDLSPKLALELMTGNANAALIDIRNEDQREKDGIPDLRQAARFRYASVTPMEADGYVRKFLKSGRELDDSLIAAVIRNLKIVKDSSKVIVMDANGTRSKGIARSLRKIGVKNTYLVQGGFQSWVKKGLRIKELKSETTLTILNEEAEAILEDISPSPWQVLGYGMVLITGLYALLEWEKTLQLIGVFGLSLTIYQRVASYVDSKDFEQDVRLLLAPLRVAAQAVSWAAGKLESNGIGLPTSPSSSDVQNRVLQAAAKHESQPSDTDGSQDPVPEPTVSLNENA